MRSSNVASAGFEPTTLGLWAWRRTTMPPRPLVLFPICLIRFSDLLSFSARLHPVNMGDVLQKSPFEKLQNESNSEQDFILFFSTMMTLACIHDRKYSNENWFQSGKILKIIEDVSYSIRYSQICCLYFGSGNISNTGPVFNHPMDFYRHSFEFRLTMRLK